MQETCVVFFIPLSLEWTFTKQLDIRVLFARNPTEVCFNRAEFLYVVDFTSGCGGSFLAG